LGQGGTGASVLWVGLLWKVQEFDCQWGFLWIGGRFSFGSDLVKQQQKLYLALWTMIAGCLGKSFDL